MPVRLPPHRLLRLSLGGLLLLVGTADPGLRGSSALPFPGPIRSDDEISNSRRNILDEHPLTARAPDNDLRPKLIYFPPNPPPLGVTVNLREDRDITTGGPDQMRPFVTDPFYAPLSTFISPVVTAYQGGEGLSDGDRARLGRWQQERDALLAELRETIERLKYSSATVRLRDTIALAEKQTPALVRLEKEADDLRERLARKAPWNEHREWRLAGSGPATGAGPGMILEIQVMRAAAFYFDGLSPAQRRLLREIAMELEGTTFLPRDSRPTAQLFVFFQPETARIPRPPRLPDHAARLMRKFIDDKGRLKEELRRAVYAADAERSTRGLSRLADAQAPLLDELEQTAEDLRAALARAPEFQRTPYPAPLPPHLVERIERYQQAKRELVGLHGRADDAGLEPLLDDLDALRAAIDLVPGARREEGQAPDAFLTNFLRSRREAAAYYEYDIATLEPGLSPEQRRLLFSGAITRLELPLPGAEEQPTLPPGTLLR
jgi:hypothetical protein